MVYGNVVGYVQGDIQNLDLDVNKSDHMHDCKNFPFSKDRKALDVALDVLRTRHETDTRDCIDEVEAIFIVHTIDDIMINKFKISHDQNRVFDRGKNLC